MPKFPKGFGRRKSTANELDDVPVTSGESTFKVFERDEGSTRSFDGGAKFGKSAMLSAARPKTSNDDNMFENIYNR